MAMVDATLTRDRPQQAGVTFTQDDRLLAIDTPLGKDKLLLTRLVGEDEISKPFRFHITMFSEDQEIAPESLIGHKVAMRIRNYRAGEVPISGIVRSFSPGPVDARSLRTYQAEIVPWLWFLNYTTDSRIFQHLTVPKIIETIFGEYGFTDYEMKLIGTYKPLDFCVQYRETALAFISRWMEEIGIFYYFRHEADRHMMVLGDDSLAFRPVVEKNAVFSSESSGDVTAWRHSYEFQSGRYAHKDFAFKTPSQDLLAKQSSILKLRQADALEVYDYPGGYTLKDDGQALTRLRMEELEAAYHSVTGAGTCASFFAGGRFTMARHELTAEENKDYVLRRVVHRARDYTHLSADAPPPIYGNSFQAFPAETRFRSPSCTPWPIVKGPQTATVVGPPGETIYTDKYGRVKLQFHWDRRGTSDDKSSCWVRVSQNWAGKRCGGMFIPHVGHEVVVSFLEGDPDMPLVTGRVYHAENMQAIDLPANKTQSSIQDHSGNFITMEGKGGAQDVRVNAVKDMHETIANDRVISVDGTHTETIEGDTTIKVTAGKLHVEAAENQAEYVSKQDTMILSVDAAARVFAKTLILLDVGDSHFLMKADGSVELSARQITIKGSDTVTIIGGKIFLNP